MQLKFKIVVRLLTFAILCSSSLITYSEDKIAKTSNIDSEESINPCGSLGADDTAGDLNGDGILDCAKFNGEISGQYNPDTTLTLSVYLGAEKGGFKLYGTSLDTMRHERAGQEVKISDSSLKLKRGVRGSHFNYSSEEFVFAFVDQNLVLVKYESTEEQTKDFEFPESKTFKLGNRKDYIKKTGFCWRDAEGKHVENNLLLTKFSLVKFTEFEYGSIDLGHPGCYFNEKFELQIW